MTAPLEELESCRDLSLVEFSEPVLNGLRLLVVELVTSADTESIVVGKAQIHGLQPIRVTESSRRFELTWEKTVAVCVLNESYSQPDDARDVRVSGQCLREYSRSRFLDWVAASTIAEALLGPLRHYRLVCWDHIVDVIAACPPTVGVPGHTGAE